MDPLTTAAAGGMRARLESLDMLANNIANASTSGFKVDREFYSIYLDEEAQAGVDEPIDGVQPLIEKPWTDFSQGTLQNTGKNLDLAISGKGFFAVNGPSGPLYTRAGSFQMSADGTVVTPEGYGVRLASGAPLKLASGLPFQISTDGTVTQGGATLGKVEIVSLPEEGIAKQGSTFFRIVDPKQRPGAASGTELHQGKLEASNVSTPETAVRLMSLMRQFESLQKAVGIGAEMNRRAIEEVARVGS